MKSGAIEQLSTSLDKIVRVEIHALHKSWPAFRTCGYIGLGASVFLVVTLAIESRISPWRMGGIAAVAGLTFLGLAMATKIITGKENLTNYHYGITVMLVTTALLQALRLPVLPYLDLTILGMGLFLACGRVGCLMVGCCHGRPHPWGVHYRKEHAGAGLPSYLVGVTLFPIQALESLWVFGIVAVGTTFILRGFPPGTALAWCVITYSVGRFCFEFMRGDPARAYLWGFSEAQWTSLLLSSAVSSAELAGLLPFHWWHAAASSALVCALAVVLLKRGLQQTPKHQLLHSRHIKELAEVIEVLSESGAKPAGADKSVTKPGAIHVGSTSLGVRVSIGQLNGAAGCVYHCTLSNRAGDMTREAAQVVAELILQLRGMPGRNEIIGGSRGVFHLVYTGD